MFSLFQNVVLFSIHLIVFKQFPFVHLEKSVSKFWVGKLYWNDNGNFEKTYICNCIEKLMVPPARPGQADWCWLSLHIHHIQLKVQSSHRTRIRKTSFLPHLDSWPGAIFAGASFQGCLQFFSTASHRIIKFSRSPFWVQNNMSTSYSHPY